MTPTQYSRITLGSVICAALVAQIACAPSNSQTATAPDQSPVPVKETSAASGTPTGAAGTGTTGTGTTGNANRVSYAPHATETGTASAPIDVQLTPENYFSYNGNVIDALQLDALIKDRIKHNPDQKVNLSAAPDTPNNFTRVAGRCIIGSGIKPENLKLTLNPEEADPESEDASPASPASLPPPPASPPPAP